MLMFPFQTRYDYTSIGFGGGFTKLFNEKNTEISVKANAYLDQWRPIYPIELREYAQYRPVFRIPDTFQAFLYSIKMVLDRKPIYLPLNPTKDRNSYSASISVSQILTKDSIIHFYGCFATGRFVGNISKSLFCW
jgi:hypothetical protein